MPFNKVLFSVFIILCTAQFLFPILAARIKARFKELGYKWNLIQCGRCLMSQISGVKPENIIENTKIQKLRSYYS